MKHRLLGPSLLAFGLVACGDSDPVAPAAAPLCQTRVDECLVTQHGCAVAGDGSESCQACPSGHYAAKTGQCTPIAGEAIAHSFPDTTTEAGGEIRGQCRSWTLENEGELWINAVEIDQNEASHHSNWTYVPDDTYEGPDGIWPCAERDYDQLTAALSGGVLYAQSTQTIHEVQKFPDGVVVRIPPHARIISDIHTLNIGAESVTGHMNVTLYALAPEAVTLELTPFHLDYHGLDIPPQSHSRFTGECNVDESFQQQTDAPLAMEVYYLLPHTHALGTRMFVEVLGGSRDGETLVDVHGTTGEARGRAFDPPIDMAGTEGFRFGCEFENPTDENVIWGFDDQEMCEALGFAASPVAFESRVDTAQAGASDGGIDTFTGPCETLSFLW